MADSKHCFVIINPTSGNGSGRKKWSQIQKLLKAYEFVFEFEFTKYSNHSSVLVQNAIKKGYTNIISIGGDGTLHNIINGILTQSDLSSEEINVGVIPIGTGNDWIKTHKIPKQIESAIQIIKNGIIKQQDVGKIDFLNMKKKSVYFINLAGVGFDGYVVSKVNKYKRFGALAYLIGAILGMFSFKNFNSKTIINSEIIESKTLMILIGICSYSGGGMQLTKTPNYSDGIFDISVAKNLSKLDIIKNIANLYNGKIVNYKKVETRKSDVIQIEIKNNDFPYIQADGELLGKGDISVTILPKAFSFYCK